MAVTNSMPVSVDPLGIRGTRDTGCRDLGVFFMSKNPCTTPTATTREHHCLDACCRAPLHPSRTTVLLMPVFAEPPPPATRIRVADSLAAGTVTAATEKMGLLKSTKLAMVARAATSQTRQTHTHTHTHTSKYEKCSD